MYQTMEAQTDHSAHIEAKKGSSPEAQTDQCALIQAKKGSSSADKINNFGSLFLLCLFIAFWDQRWNFLIDGFFCIALMSIFHRKIIVKIITTGELCHLPCGSIF